MKSDWRPGTIALMLESDGPGGAEIILFNLATELRARGYDAVPVLPAGGTGWLGERLRASGFEPESFHFRPPPDWRLVRDLARMMRRRRVELVHSHEFAMAVYGAAASRLVGLPQVVTLHGPHRLAEVLRRRVAARWAFRASRAVTVVSRATQSQLARDLGLRPQAFCVVHNGVPVRVGSPVQIRQELAIGEGDLLIVAVGNLDEHKGHIYLLEALHRLSVEGVSVPWRLAIAGGRGGACHRSLTEFVARRGLAPRIQILTHRDDVPDLLSAAEVFVMPSLWEGLPLALLEAMLAGKAIVASEVFGIPEAITPGEHGLLVPAGDSGELARALRRLLEDAHLRKRLGQAAKQRAMREFTLSTMTDAFERVYAESSQRFA